MIKQILLFTILILGVSPILAQVPQKIQIDADGNPINTPEMAAKIKRWRETQENLDSDASFSAKLEGSNISSKDDAVQISRQKLDDLKFSFFIESKTQTAFDLSFNDGEVMVRPVLKQNGKIIDYTKDRIKWLQSKESSVSAYHTGIITFPPATKMKIPDFAGIRGLQEWYDPLEIGYYELTFKFVYGKKTLISQPISFEVLPE